MPPEPHAAHGTHSSTWEDRMDTMTEAACPTLTLDDAERQPCEVWTRVMGYHRPVASFNVGKKGEHRERRFFCEPSPARDARKAG